MVEQAEALTKQYSKSFLIWNFIGVANIDLGRLEEASTALEKVVELNPNYAVGFNNLSVALQDQGNLDKAIEASKKAISLKPDYVDALYNMGNILKDQDKLEEAIMIYKKVISLKPDYFKVYNNIGVTFHNQLKLDKAISSYNKALSLNYVSADLYTNIATTLKFQGKLNESIEASKKAISLKNDHFEAHQSLAFSLLNSGELEQGFDENEWRWKNPKQMFQKRHFKQKLWDGKISLDNQTILLWCEQGVGDTIMWSSRLSLLTAKAHKCILECQKKLVPLLKRSFPNIEIKTQNRGLDLERDDFDFHLPMGNLYKHFIQNLSQNTKFDAFLFADPERIKFWKKRLSSLGKGPYIGISWKSTDMSRPRLPNYAPLSEWSPILKIPEVTFINLQYSDFANDLIKAQNKFGVKIHNFNDLDHFNNIDDVAALCSALDFVVSTKTTVPLISAGVGTSTKLANWKQSPWNNVLMNPVGPNVDIFERNTWESWDKIFKQIAENILKIIKSKSY